MNIEDYLNSLSTKNENQTKLIFKELGFKYQKLDELSLYENIKCPDFLFSQNSIRYLCEVKTLHSAYYDINLGHISMTMPTQKVESNLFTIDREKAMKKITAAFEDSIIQRNSICSIESDFDKIPFLVAFYFDFFADDFLSIIEVINQFPEISAAIKAYQSCNFKNEFGKLSVDVMEKVIDGKSKVDLPPLDDFPHWHYVLNPNAKIVFNPQKLGICEYDQYFEMQS